MNNQWQTGAPERRALFLAECKARLGPTWGISVECRERAGQVKSPAELRASIGMTEDAWNALPDARER